MKIRVLGGGWYGSHLTAALIEAGHDVELHEISDALFSGASGGIPARVHGGQHYPRSWETRAACQHHKAEFMALYGGLTRGVPVNIYAIASQDSLVDFAQYRATLRGEIEFITVHDPAEFGLTNVEGAILTGERHIVIRKAREYFEALLHGHVQFGMEIGYVNDRRWDWTIDCSFCANDNEAVDRYEPCLTVLLTGKADRAVTIMDGGFGSVYPWDEEACLSSLTSASLTPISKQCRTYAEAKAMLDAEDEGTMRVRAEMMLRQMSRFWPEVRDRYRIADFKLSIRAMPKSAADTRLVDVVRVGERAIRVRAGKIDAILHAERIVREMISAGRK